MIIIILLISMYCKYPDTTHSSWPTELWSGDRFRPNNINDQNHIRCCPYLPTRSITQCNCSTWPPWIESRGQTPITTTTNATWKRENLWTICWAKIFRSYWRTCWSATRTRICPPMDRVNLIYIVNWQTLEPLYGQIVPIDFQQSGKTSL